jgi:catechol 2,3-dioxygenase-like lactoylglutathione lyase family enzyme
MREPPFDAQVTFCRTEDLEAATTFYRDRLGLPLVLDQGRCCIFRVSRDGYLGLCEHLEGASPDGVILTLVSEDVDGWHARLVAEGVGIEKPPTRNEEFRIYHLFLRDPDGHLVEIQRFEDPAWPG